MGCLCHVVLTLRQEGICEVGEGSRCVKTEGVERCGRGCYCMECLREVVEGRV